MRTLLSIHAGAEHFWPLEPVARTLVHAGHEVAVCSPRSTRATVEECGFTFFEAGLDWPALMRGFTTRPLLPLPPFGPGWARQVFAEVTPHYMIPDLLVTACQWQPDLIVRDATEYGGPSWQSILASPMLLLSSMHSQPSIHQIGTASRVTD